MIIKLLDALFGRELIGNPDCPIMYRWYIRGKRGHNEDHALKRKWMIHYFLPDADDEDPHDHPRGFWTLVLRGMYQDIRYLYGDGEHARMELDHLATETMRPFMLRYRPARHLHRTRVGPKGCWTIVMMTEFERDWGFVREGRWWPWARYLKEIGNAMLCPGSEEAYRREGLVGLDGDARDFTLEQLRERRPRAYALLLMALPLDHQVEDIERIRIIEAAELNVKLKPRVERVNISFSVVPPDPADSRG